LHGKITYKLSSAKNSRSILLLIELYLNYRKFNFTLIEFFLVHKVEQLNFFDNQNFFIQLMSRRILWKFFHVHLLTLKCFVTQIFYHNWKSNWFSTASVNAARQIFIEKWTSKKVKIIFYDDHRNIERVKKKRVIIQCRNYNMDFN
jgi:hypothetical protein